MRTCKIHIKLSLSKQCTHMYSSRRTKQTCFPHATTKKTPKNPLLLLNVFLSFPFLYTITSQFEICVPLHHDISGIFPARDNISSCLFNHTSCSVVQRFLLNEFLPGLERSVSTWRGSEMLCPQIWSGCH